MEAGTLRNICNLEKEPCEKPRTQIEFSKTWIGSLRVDSDPHRDLIAVAGGYFVDGIEISSLDLLAIFPVAQLAKETAEAIRNLLGDAARTRILLQREIG